jgi:hypothetical protein
MLSTPSAEQEPARTPNQAGSARSDADTRSRRTIAATFVRRPDAEAARERLERQIEPEQLAVAPAVVATTDESPIDQPRTIVAVTVDRDGDVAREVLRDAGGHLVADVTLDGDS